LPGLDNELETSFFPQVIIQQDEIDGLLEQHSRGFPDRGTTNGHLHIGLGLKQPAQALSEESVIVQ
jgi:hypothetical protein